MQSCNNMPIIRPESGSVKSRKAYPEAAFFASRKRSAVDSIGIALIGYGMIGRVHSLAYHELPIFYPGGLPPLRLVGVSTSRPETARAAAAAAGYDSWSTDYRELLARDDVDVIDCSTPNHTHRPLILDALRAGKHVYCEKPLALDGAEARTLVALEIFGELGALSFILADANWLYLSGLVLTSSNLPAWNRHPLRDQLARGLDLPVAQIVPSALGEDSGIVGAADLAWAVAGPENTA